MPLFRQNRNGSQVFTLPYKDLHFLDHFVSLIYNLLNLLQPCWLSQHTRVFELLVKYSHCLEPSSLIIVWHTSFTSSSISYFPMMRLLECLLNTVHGQVFQIILIPPFLSCFSNYPQDLSILNVSCNLLCTYSVCP